MTLATPLADPGRARLRPPRVPRRLAAAQARLPRPGRSSTGSGPTSCAATGSWSPARRRSPSPARTRSSSSTTTRSSSCAAATACCAPSTTCAATGARPWPRSRAARSSASSARTTPGSTTSTARSSGPSTPTTSTTSRSRTTAWPRSASRPGRASSSSTSTRTRRRCATSSATSSSTGTASTSRPCGAAKRIEYDVKANWKFIAENYSECYHCPGVHPQLNKLTPVRPGRRLRPERGVAGRLDGAGRRRRDDVAGRPPTARRAPGTAAGRRWPGSRPHDERCVYYYVVWPTTFLSIHPDYLLVHRLVPVGPDRTTGHLRLAVRGRDDGRARLRPVRRGRVLGPDQRPGLARLRAPAARHALVVVGRRPLLERRRRRSTPSTRWSPTATSASRRGRSASSASTTTSRCPRPTAACPPASRTRRPRSKDRSAARSKAIRPSR